MKWGKQVTFCPNCGKKRYEAKMADTCKAMVCYPECLKEWELKYAKYILGKDGDDAKETNP